MSLGHFHLVPFTEVACYALDVRWVDAPNILLHPLRRERVADLQRLCLVVLEYALVAGVGGPR